MGGVEGLEENPLFIIAVLEFQHSGIKGNILAKIVGITTMLEVINV